MLHKTLALALAHALTPPHPNTRIGVPSDIMMPHNYNHNPSDTCRRILSEAGFADIVLRPHDLPFTVTEASDMPTALKAVTTRGPSGRLLADSGDEVVARVQAELAPLLEPHLGPGGLSLGSAIWVVTARAPS